MSIKTIILLILLTLPTVLAADWVEVSLKYTWDRKANGFCKETPQCLVSNAFNESWDNLPDRYWSGLVNNERPKCITTGQYISDNYCESGSWTSRTKLIATQLLAIALNQSPSDFSLYCDEYDKVLNKYAYSTDYGTVTSFIRGLCLQPGNKRSDICVNNLCVLNANGIVAFGMAMNTEISGPKSTLQALNLSSDECDSAKNIDGDYDFCGDNVWYNHDTQSIIYTTLGTLPAPTPIVQDFFMTPYSKLKTYVFSVVHKPDIAQYNYTFFNTIPQFKEVYMAKEGLEFIYGFKQNNITQQQISYAGWYFSNIQLPEDACNRIIKRYDGRANCEEQPTPTEFYIVAHKTPPTKGEKRTSIVDAWNDMTGKLRVST
jgi:hypothetical protein